MGDDSEHPDRVRLLAARSEWGYTDNRFKAMRDEPEAVSRQEQERQTQLARRRERQHRLDAWRPARSLISAGIVSFQSAADPQSRSDLRLIERAVRKIDARLGA